jgi:hypothetical protein
LAPGETATYTIEWDQRDENGEQVPLGDYVATPDVTDLWGGRRMELVVGGAALRIVPSGVMRDGTVEFNVSKTVDNMTLTLDRMEFAPAGTQILASCRLPGYRVGSVVEIFAFYRIDDGFRETTGKARIEHLADGVRFTWGGLEPVPNTSRQYTLSVTGFNYDGRTWEDPWEFTIALK